MPKNQTISGSDIILKALQDQNVDTIFGYPGGAVLPIYDSIFQQNHVKHILVRHEQAAVHAAEGYARSTGKTGVVLVTSGPGATNAVTGLTDALMDSVPLVCLTGQVPTHLIGTDAFQECDTTGITRQCTKHNYLVKDVKDLSRILHEAFYVARSGRPGPVVIDIPKNIQFEMAEYENLSTRKHNSYQPKINPDPKAISQAVDMLMAAKKPIIYGGGGLVNSGEKACEYLTEFVNLTDIPCTLTLLGLGALSADHPRFLGMLGMHGTYEANLAMHGCDVMLAVGSRFDDRITGAVDKFSPNSKKIHIDIDASSFNKNVRIDLPILGDCALALDAILSEWKRRKASIEKAALKKWHKQIESWIKVDCLKYKQGRKIIKPQHAIRRLHELSQEILPKKPVYVTTEVGQHQMWAAQYFPFYEPKHWMTSGGLGTMGYGFPSAIGVQTAHPDALVVDIAGEASILMNIQELSTAVQYRLPVKIFILNNRYLGMVRQWQELLHGGRYSESYAEALPDFVKLAESFGATGVRAETIDELDAAIIKMLKTDGMVVADIAVDKSENCFPMIPSGKAHNEMILGSTSDQKIDEKGKVLV